MEFIACGIFLIAANYTDFVGYKIKNVIILPLVIIGLILGLYRGDICDSLLGMIIPLILIPLYALRMLGAGDIKALCAIGAALGMKKSIEVLIFTFICGGILAVIFMVVSKNGKERFKNLFRWITQCICLRKAESYNFGGGEKSYFRFSYAITLGFAFTVFNSYFNIIAI